MCATSLLPLDSPLATLQLAGGKGANLARLARAGFPVPPGWFITTDAYREYVAANDIQPVIATALSGLVAGDPSSLEAASRSIRDAFAAGALQPALAAALLDRYAALGEPPVAVRSSATAEDLPDLSFAGQQETFLNVRDADALLHALVSCWGSLWTARAIGYRARNAIDQTQVALAVVVQQMIDSEVSGVLFTSNPLTGLRAETVIDATLGLGEALVSGLVEPDHYVVETETGRILTRTLGSKAISIRSARGGGVARTEEDAAAHQALPDPAIRELAALGAQVAGHYGGEPQDIEWAWADDRLYLLQARPITSLFPLPSSLPPDRLSVMFSFGAVQGMQDPMTPLGQDAFRFASAGFARLWGYDFAPGAVPALHFAGERMWIRINPLLTNNVGHSLAHEVLKLIEAGASHALEQVDLDPRLAQSRRAPSPQALRRIGRVLPKLLAGIAAALARPDARRAHALQTIEDGLTALESRAATRRTLTDKAAFAEEVFQGFVATVIRLLPVVAAGMASFFRAVAIAERAGIPRSRVLEITRGLPYNVTTEMDLALWDVARAIQQDSSSLATLTEWSAANLARAYLAGTLPSLVQTSVGAFLDRYGMRGVGEIDFGRPRWREDPTHVFQMVRNYLQITDPALAPDALFRRGAQAAEEAIEALTSEIGARRSPRDARVFAFFARRARRLMGLRETPKYSMIRLMGIVHALLLDAFRDLAARGVLDDPEDGFYVRLAELRALDAGYEIDWKALVRARRELYAREMRRRQVPRLLLSDGRAFYGGAGNVPADGESVLTGTPVSPGVAEGIVHVVLEPHNAHLLPGEILVCPGTDPAWTPLFLSASALVMEVGGLMTHGSVVAREFGIPAVVGVARVTERLRTGQRIRVDGSAGLVTLVDG